MAALVASLLLSTFSVVASITCFLSSTSLVRRDVIQIIPGRNLITCQAACMNDPACTAIQITSSSRNCVIFGADITLTIGSCPAPFTCMLKTTTGCIPKARRPIDLGYVADYCSGAVQSAPADDGRSKPCGTFAIGNQTVFIDALLHDGTNKVLENYNAGFMISVPSTNVQCPAYIQFSFMNIYDGTAKQAVYTSDVPRHVYCANRVWMEVTEAVTRDSYALTAASCVSPSPG
ncbi:hypothetical protein PRIPAC_82786 [Pristionchus pacificus]|uniref:Apple domain-containing protein n=1 Tax=Pristionchus pacificus TaxID=54126 RepID=A0A2A6CLV0_PRIPA|nr:hypothetical protein PRIPAC_82786 [Pristionchus pacificus]|eukprot:PDM79184.1 hypothetical protein PRIPAC_31763 [Pristionchus pacificus]